VRIPNIVRMTATMATMRMMTSQLG